MPTNWLLLHLQQEANDARRSKGTEIELLKKALIRRRDLQSFNSIREANPNVRLPEQVWVQDARLL